MTRRRKEVEQGDRQRFKATLAMVDKHTLQWKRGVEGVKALSKERVAKRVRHHSCD